jgi:hypothetical protein
MHARHLARRVFTQRTQRHREHREENKKVKDKFMLCDIRPGSWVGSG